MTKILIVILVTMLFSLSVISTSNVDINAIPQNKQQIIDDNYIVVFNDDVEDVEIKATKMAEEHGILIKHVYKHALKGFSAMIPPHKIDKIKNDPMVRFVEQDKMVQAFQSSQIIPTGINRIDAERTVKRTVNVDIAVIDTGIDKKHPDLYVYKGVTCLGAGRPGGNDDNGHGTHVAGIAAAKDNDIGVVGVAPGARLWSVKVLDKYGSGTLSCVIAGIDYVTQHADEIEVANMSLGCRCSTPAGDTALNSSVAAGVTYIVAAGNEASDVKDFWPASNPNVITVSAIADSDGRCGSLGSNTIYGGDDTFANFSNYGSGVDIAAPGVYIYSTYKGGKYATMSGTSMASPHVAGAAALYKASNQSATPSEVKDYLIANGIPQDQQCDISTNNGRGGFTGDNDAYKERLVYAGNLP